MIENIYF